MPFPLLTERLSIQPLAMGDLDSFVEYRTDPDIARFQSWDTSYSRQQAQELIESQAGVQLPKQGDWLQLAIHDQASGQHVGDLAIHAVIEQDDTFELGFTIAKKHQRQGFASESVRAMIEHLSTVAQAKKVIATTDRRNLSSIKLLMGLGFVPEATKSWTEEFKGEIVTVDYFEKLLREK